MRDGARVANIIGPHAAFMVSGFMSGNVSRALVHLIVRASYRLGVLDRAKHHITPSLWGVG
jgi:hypothetical protein